MHAFNTNPAPWCCHPCDDVAWDAGVVSMCFLHTMAYCFSMLPHLEVNGDFCVVYVGVSTQTISELYSVIGITVDICKSCRSSVCAFDIPGILCYYRARILRVPYVCLVILMLEIIVYFVPQTNASVIYICRQLQFACKRSIVATQAVLLRNDAR